MHMLKGQLLQENTAQEQDLLIYNYDLKYTGKVTEIWGLAWHAE